MKFTAGVGKCAAWTLIVAAATASLMNLSWAQSAPQAVDVRYETIVKLPDRNKSTPGNQFGDQHSLESGALSFNVVDVSLPGNSDLDVEFRRVLDMTDQTRWLNGRWVIPWSRLRNWKFGLPRISASYDARAGWVSSDPQRPTKNCSVISAEYSMPPKGILSTYIPPGLNVRGLEHAFLPRSFWSPPTLHLPDGSARALLYNDSNMQEPSSGGEYYWLTATNGYLSCIESIRNRSEANAEERIFSQGEGYLLLTPDGKRYRFDWMALESRLPAFTTIVSTMCNSGGCQDIIGNVSMEQVTLALYPTRVEDRFGNWVLYTYSNKSNEYVKLDRIEANDGRLIEVIYDSAGLVQKVVSDGREWAYVGGDSGGDVSGFLAEVVNPDGAAWSYSGVSHPQVAWPFQTTGEGLCQNLEWTKYQNVDRTVTDEDIQGFSVTSPSGAVGIFRVEPVMLGRSGVRPICDVSGYSLRYGLPYQMTSPRINLGGFKLALTGKRVSGPGVDPMIWRYHYRSDIGFNPVLGQTQAKVLAPDGVMASYVYGNRAGADEGLLLSVSRSIGQQVVSSESFSYAVGDSYPGFPRRVGFHPISENLYGDMYLRPLVHFARSQDGRSFNWSVARGCGGSSGICLDDFGRPTRVVRESQPL